MKAPQLNGKKSDEINYSDYYKSEDFKSIVIMNFRVKEKGFKR